jgi:hypothetical protein
LHSSPTSPPPFPFTRSTAVCCTLWLWPPLPLV